MLHLSRSATLDGFARVVGELGLDPVGLVDEVGLPAKCLSDPDLKIPTEAVLALYNLVAERAGIDDFGLRVARTRQFSNLGAVGLVMREQPDVRSAIGALAANIWAQAEGLSIVIEEVDGLVILRTSIARAPGQAVRQTIELALAIIANILRRFIGQHWIPEMVLFSHARPANMALHIAAFGRPPVFGQYIDAIVLRATDLDIAIPEADAGTAAQLLRYLEFVAGRRTTDFSAKVRQMIGVLLPAGRAQADLVARQLGIDRRTLHRRLARQGTSFSDILQRERREMAQAYIDAGDRSLTEIAELLGFSCLSAFSRWRRTPPMQPSQIAEPRGSPPHTPQSP